MFNGKTYGKVEIYIDYANLFHCQKCLENPVNIIDVISRIKGKFKNIDEVRFYNGLRTLNYYEKLFSKKIIAKFENLPKELIKLEDKIKFIGYRKFIESISSNYKNKDELIRKLKDRSFLCALEKNNITVVSKKVKNIEGKDKANFDVEITTDALLRKDFYDTLVLFSGDWDFVYLLDVLTKQFFKKIVIVSLEGHISGELMHYNGTNSYVDLIDLLKSLGIKNSIFHRCKKTP